MICVLASYTLLSAKLAVLLHVIWSKQTRGHQDDITAGNTSHDPEVLAVEILSTINGPRMADSIT